MWTCAYCGEANPADADLCEVCGLSPAPGPAEPVARGLAPGPPPPLPPRRDPVTAPAPRADPDPMADHVDETAYPVAPPLAPHLPEPGRPEPGRPEPGRPEPGRPEPGLPEPGRRRSLAPLIAAVGLLAAVVLAGFLLAQRLLGGDPGTTAGEQPPPPAATGTATIEPAPDETTPDDTTPDETTPDETAPAGATPDGTAPDLSPPGTAASVPAEVGLVTIDPAVTDSRAVAIATMFDTYFSGINAKDYDTVARTLDPAGVVDPTDPDAMAALAEGTRTTQNSDIELLRVGDTVGGTRAEVAFRSNQEPGAGPRGREEETCTRWRIDYTLTGAGGDYRILRGAATSRPC